MATIVLPIVEAAGRPLGFSISGTADNLHLVLWLTFLGGLLATREGKHLRLSTADLVKHPQLQTGLGVFAGGVAASVSLVLAYASWQVVEVSRADGMTLPIGLPVWLSESVMPLALAIMGLRFVWRVRADGSDGLSPWCSSPRVLAGHHPRDGDGVSSSFRA